MYIKNNYYNPYACIFPYKHHYMITENDHAIIVNTHPSTKNGEHWQTIYFSIDGNNRICYFFDSYGLPPPEHLTKFINQNSEKTCYEQLQSFLSIRCGEYCCVFPHFMARNKKYKNLVKISQPI